jgi:hypothetical protein
MGGLAWQFNQLNQYLGKNMGSAASGVIYAGWRVKAA